jgi:SAM-dependent methyltransferase
MKKDRDYILGTHDEEIARLGLQHRVWRARALDAWKKAGFTAGSSVLDLGCGPGFASLDLAEIVGASGKIISVDRSRKFLDTLEGACRVRGLQQVETYELDLDENPLPAVKVDGAWARWVFAFMKQPYDLLKRVAGTLHKGGTLVLHEYFHYNTWQFSPTCPEHDEFVKMVVRSWRESGGEPDIGLRMPEWMGESDLEITSITPIIEIITPADFMWQWPKAFIDVGMKRFVDLGYVTEDRAEAMTDAIAEFELRPNVHMITPAVVEIIAEKQ